MKCIVLYKLNIVLKKSYYPVKRRLIIIIPNTFITAVEED